MSVAIRTATRVQDQDDVNVTVGAGVDGYALVWDNGAGEFVLAAAGVTDHGALTGLSDDDHSQYLLATGARTGASSQAQAFTVGVTLADTTTSTTGVVFKGVDRFIHNFHHPTGNTAVPLGRNVFIGVTAGNFTLGSTAASTSEGSDNVGIGQEALLSLTTGSRNVAIGTDAGRFIQAGADNVCIGHIAGRGLTGSRNFALGYQTLYVTSGSDNTAIGYRSMPSNTSGQLNVAIGRGTLENSTTGSNNIAIGYNAAKVQADGTTALTDPENSVYIGASVRGFNNSDTNVIVIGYSAIGQGANTTVIGNTSTTVATLYGAGAFPLLSAVTNAVSNLLTLTHDTSGTAAAGFGAGLLFNLESSTTAAQAAARIQALWYEATHASRKADLVLTAYDTAEREGLRIRGAGSAPAIGFYGVTPIERATLATGAGASVDDVITALQNLGLVKQS